MNHKIAPSVLAADFANIQRDVEMINNSEAGDNVGLLLDGVQKKNITRGMVVTEPNSVKSYYKFEALIYILTASEGGLYTPFFNRFKSLIIIILFLMQKCLIFSVK